MTVEEKLRDTLQRRAEAAEPSFDGWAAITRRIDRHQRRTHNLRVSLVTGMAVAAVVLAVAVVAVNGPQAPDQNVAATGGGSTARTSTTMSSSVAAPATVVTAPGSVTIPALPRPEEGGTGGSSIGPMPPGYEGEPATAGSNPLSKLGSMWPETQADLDRAQAAVNDGHQPWWTDPGTVTSAFLGDRGVAPPDSVSTRPGTPYPDGAAVRYTSGSAGGWVFVRRPSGSVYFVTGARTDRLVHVHAVRDGDRLTVDVIAIAPGKVVVRTKRLGSDWNPSTATSVAAGKQASVSVAAPTGADLILQIRHEGGDGTVGVFEDFVWDTGADLTYNALRPGVVVGFGKVGPVGLGTSLVNAEIWAGVPMTVENTEHCASVSTAGEPEGVSYLDTRGDGAVNVMIVSAPGLVTTEGIQVGSSADEVRQAYPGLEDRAADGSGRLVARQAAPGTGGDELVFTVADDQVTEIWTGHDGLSNSDELCA